MLATHPPTPLPATPEGGESDRVGAATHLFWDPVEDAMAALSALAASGVRRIRNHLCWSDLQPTADEWSWWRSDGLFTAAAVVGVDVLPVLVDDDPWRSRAAGVGVRSDAFERYAACAAGVVSRYGAGGAFWAEHAELTPRPLEALEVWDEPWGWWSWRPDPEPAAYARLVRAVADAVGSSVDVVASARLAAVRAHGGGDPWTEAVLAADPGLVDAVDVWSVHPVPAWEAREVAEIERVLTDRAGAPPRLWLVDSAHADTAALAPVERIYFSQAS